jgi:hypothetical protein
MGEKLFVGVDEFDSPANGCLLENTEDRSNYARVAELFKTQFFAIMKSGCHNVIKKYWLTGIVPMFRDGISPLHATSIISNLPQYNGCCGFTEDEVQIITTNYLPKHSEDDLATAMQDMKLWYSGYRFCPAECGSSSTLYNTQWVFDHLRAVEQQMWSANQHSTGHAANVLNAVSTHGDVTVDDFVPLLSGRLQTRIATEFGADDVQQLGHRPDVTWGLLTYYGVITQDDERNGVKIPNRRVQVLVCLCRWL